MVDMSDGLAEDGKTITKKDIESAKFTKDKDTVDVVQPTAKLIGLTKEQLEQYRNDPFWKAVRYTLFVAFWLVWLAMFVGAILIVVLSPKCPEVKWTQKMVNYKIFTLAYKDSDAGSQGDGFGDFAGIKEKLGDLKDIGVSAIWPSPVFSFSKNELGPEAVIALDVSDQLGGANAFKELVKLAHAKDIKVVVDLPLTVDAKVDNWAKSLAGGYAENKNGIALVDLGNAQVRDQLIGAVKSLLDFGIDALSITDYGLFNSPVPSAFVQQIRTLPGAEHLPIFSASPVDGSDIYHISSLVGDKASGEGLEGLKAKLEDNLNRIENGEGAAAGVVVEEGGNHTAAQRMFSLGSADPNGARLDQLLGTKAKSLSNEQKQRIASLFTAIQLFIPGPTSVLYGEELGLLSGKPSNNKKINRVAYPWNNETSRQNFFAVPETTKNGTFESQRNDPTSPLGLFKTIAKLRQGPDFVLGKFGHSNSGSLGIYAVRRFPSDDGFFLLAINWGEATINLGNEKLPKELKEAKLGAVEVRASTEKGTGAKLNLGAGAEPVKLAPYSALVLNVSK